MSFLNLVQLYFIFYIQYHCSGYSGQLLLFFIIKHQNFIHQCPLECEWALGGYNAVTSSGVRLLQIQVTDLGLMLSVFDHRISIKKVFISIRSYVVSALQRLRAMPHGSRRCVTSSSQCYIFNALDAARVSHRNAAIITPGSHPASSGDPLSDAHACRCRASFQRTVCSALFIIFKVPKRCDNVGVSGNELRYDTALRLDDDIINNNSI